MPLKMRNLYGCAAVAGTLPFRRNVPHHRFGQRQTAWRMVIGAPACCGATSVRQRALRRFVSKAQGRDNGVLGTGRGPGAATWEGLRSSKTHAQRRSPEHGHAPSLARHCHRERYWLLGVEESAASYHETMPRGIGRWPDRGLHWLAGMGAVRYGTAPESRRWRRARASSVPRIIDSWEISHGYQAQ